MSKITITPPTDPFLDGDAPQRFARTHSVDVPTEPWWIPYAGGFATGAILGAVLALWI